MLVDGGKDALGVAAVNMRLCGTSSAEDKKRHNHTNVRRQNCADLR